MKRIWLFMIAFSVSSIAAAQDPVCNCPPMKLYVYDTKMDFAAASTNAAQAGKYAEAQNSGDWLEGDYLKEQTDQFKVYKGIMPGAKTGTTYQLPPSGGTASSEGIDFTSYAEVARSGSGTAFTYAVTVRLTDAHNGTQVAAVTQSTNDLGKTDNLIDAIIGSFGSVPNKLQNYEKQLRDESGGNKWIGLKYKSTADKSTVAIHGTTNVTMTIFDCADQKPFANKQVNVKLANAGIGTINKNQVTTDGSGKAVVVFTAKNNGVTKVYPDLVFTDIWNNSGNHVTACGDQKEITVGGTQYLVKLQGEVTGPGGINYKLSGTCTTTLISFADSTYGLRPIDGTKNMQITVLAAVAGPITLKSPYNYTIPFVINVGNVGKNLDHQASSSVSIQNFSPVGNNGAMQIEVYTAQGHDMQIPGNINGMFAAAFLQLFQQSAQSNATIAQQDMAFMQRIQANENSPAYFQSAQGKTDMLALQKFAEQNGYGYSTLYGGQTGQSPNTAAINSIIQAQMATQTNPSASGTGTPSVMGGEFQVNGTFNPQSGTAMEVDEQGTSGPMHGTVKITVQKAN